MDLDVGPKPVAPTAAMPYDGFDVIPLGRSIGAEVQGLSLGDDMDEQRRSEVHRALLDWKVLFFRDQDISVDQHRRLALRWGPIEQHPFFRFVQSQDAPDVVRLAKDANLGGLENEWHNDVTWSDRPSYGAILRAVEVPVAGGDTLWSDTAAAYDGLPEQVRERLDGLTALHTWRNTFGLLMDDEQRDRFAAVVPDVEHPVVIAHPETGRRHLFVNRFFTQHIVGVSQQESDDLLARIYHQIARPEYHVRFTWTPGAVAFWDNRACQHYAVSDYHPQRRVMDRISIEGQPLNAA